VLLVCPPVFSYHVSIKAELEAMGYDVTWWNDRSSNSSLHKIGLRLRPDFFAKRSTPVFSRRLNQLDSASITRVLVVKGEGMSAEFMETLRARLPAACLTLYFWDSVENAPRAHVIAPMFDRVATFDPVDAKKYGWLYRPLFARAEAAAATAPDGRSAFDWCFVGTLHSDRYRVVERLQRAHPGLRSFFYGFAPGRIVWSARYLTDWRLWRAPRGSVSTRMMSASEVAAIFRTSRAILDVEHPRQRGLTMRTIETLLSGRKLITTNRHVLESDLFDASRVQVISRVRPQVPTPFFELAFKPIDDGVRARYTLRRWLVDLIGAAAPAAGA
jgi:hypothetical protein